MAISAYGPLTQASDNPLENPAELHRRLAESKAQALGRTRSLHTVGTTSLDQLNYDARYYDLDINLIIPTEEVVGRVYMEATSLIDSLHEIDVDFHAGMAADSVFMSGSPVAFNHVGSELYVTLPVAIDSGDGFAMTIYYHGHPASVGFFAFGFWSHGSPPVPMIWSFSQPYNARNWWPCKDTPSDKADSVDIRITCRDDLFAASNGVLISNVDNLDGTRTFRWKHGHPIATYLVSLAVTNYTQLDYEYVYNGGADTMPVNFWVYPERVTDAQNSYPEILTMLDVFGQYFGPYPFLDEKYAISHYVWGGGMEHQTNSSQGPGSSSWALNAHELAHQWWGDWVTCKTWSDIWLNEGFASWSEALYLEHQSGSAAYHSYMADMRYTSDGTIYVHDTSSFSTIFTSRVYDKGAWVVHMLRHVLGDATFLAALAEYGNQYGQGTATTDDFRAVCEHVSGMGLQEFFGDWVFGTYFPAYVQAFYTLDLGSEYLARVRIAQTQASSPQVFDMPIDLRFSDGVHDTTVVVNNNEREQYFDVPLSFEATSMELDPKEWILRDVYQGVTVVPDTVKAGQRGAMYEDTLEAAGGTLPYSWGIPVGSMPPLGLSLLPSGVLTGTPSVGGAFTFAAEVIDNGVPQSRMKRDITLNIAGSARPPGDVSNDSVVTTQDILMLVFHVFKGEPAPNPACYGDVNGSGDITSADIIYLVGYVLKSGTPPLDGCFALARTERRIP